MGAARACGSGLAGLVSFSACRAQQLQHPHLQGTHTTTITPIDALHPLAVPVVVQELELAVEQVQVQEQGQGQEEDLVARLCQAVHALRLQGGYTLCTLACAC